MAANVKRLTALGLVPELAAELARQINGAPRNRRRLQELSMVVAVSAEIVRQMQVGVGDADLLADLGISPELAAEIAAQINGGAPAPYFSVNPSITPSMGAVGQLFTAIDGTVVNGSLSGRRWLLDGVQIGIGTTVTPATAGTLRLENSASGAGGTATALSSPVTVIALSPPSWTVQPSISGTPQQGFLLTGSDGTIVGGTVTARQWRRNGVDIGGATASTYTLQGADVGALITFRVTANGAGGSASATSPATSAILPPAPAWTVQPSISGTAQQGQTLTGSDGTITNGTVSSRQWRRNGVDIGGATSSTYLLVSGDVGAVITFRVTATGAGGSNSATSTGTSAVLPPAPSWTVQPSISGTPAVGETLTGADGTIANGTVTARQWRRDGVDIGGATSSTYLVDAADAGKAITFRVTATGTGGSASATSTAVNIPGALPASLVALFNTTDLSNWTVNIDGSGGTPVVGNRLGRCTNLAPGYTQPLVATGAARRATAVDEGGQIVCRLVQTTDKSVLQWDMAEVTDPTTIAAAIMYRADGLHQVAMSGYGAVGYQIPLIWESGGGDPCTTIGVPPTLNGIEYPETTTRNAIRPFASTGSFVLLNSPAADYSDTVADAGLVYFGDIDPGGTFFNMGSGFDTQIYGDFVGIAIFQDPEPGDFDAVNSLLNEWAGNPLEIQSYSIGYPTEDANDGAFNAAISYGNLTTLGVQFYEPDGVTPIGSQIDIAATTSPQDIAAALPLEAQGVTGVQVKVLNAGNPTQSTSRTLARIPYMRAYDNPGPTSFGMGEDFIWEGTGNSGQKNVVLGARLIQPIANVDVDLWEVGAQIDGIPKSYPAGESGYWFQLRANVPAGEYTVEYPSGMTMGTAFFPGGPWAVTSAFSGGYGELTKTGTFTDIVGPTLYLTGTIPGGGAEVKVLPKGDPDPGIDAWPQTIDAYRYFGVKYGRFMTCLQSWFPFVGSYPSDTLSWAGNGRYAGGFGAQFPVDRGYCITMCNETPMNMYDTIVYFAEDSFVEEAADLYLNGDVARGVPALDMSLDVAVEYANESSWNPGGYQSWYYLRFEGCKAGLFTTTPTPIPLIQGEIVGSTGELLESYAEDDYIMANLNGQIHVWQANKNNAPGLTDKVENVNNAAWTIIADLNAVERAAYRFFVRRNVEIWDIYDDKLGAGRVKKLIGVHANNNLDPYKEGLIETGALDRADGFVGGWYWGNGIGYPNIGQYDLDLPGWTSVEKGWLTTAPEDFKDAFFNIAEEALTGCLNSFYNYRRDAYDWIYTTSSEANANRIQIGNYEWNTHLAFFGGWPSEIGPMLLELMDDSRWGDLVTRQTEAFGVSGGLHVAFIRTGPMTPTSNEKWGFSQYDEDIGPDNVRAQALAAGIAATQT